MNYRVDNKNPMEASYRDDNLITLCYGCHIVFHKAQKGLLISQAAKKRAKNVRNLFNKIKQERGWTAARQLNYQEKENET